MSKLTSFVAATSLLTASASFTMPARAAVPVLRADVAAAPALPVEKSAYFYGGRRYCFYRFGYRGPGFYLCGYPYRRGFFFAPGFFGGYGGFGHGHFGHRGFRHFGHRGFGHRGFGHGFGHHGFGHHGGGHFGRGHFGGGHFGGGHHGGGHFGGGHGGGHGGGGHGGHH